MRPIALFFLMLMNFKGGVSAQTITANAVYTQPGQKITLTPGSLFTSLVLKSEVPIEFEGAKIIANRHQFEISDNHHQEGELFYSNLVVFDQPVGSVDFLTGKLSGKIEVVYFDARLPVNFRLKKISRVNEACELPAIVSQESWRAGLPAPQYARQFTEVDHQIVHHSATSNQLKDYVNLVRNIYLFHTQERGWSDIGYNYLVAPDGTVFAGRDPGNGRQDNVLGAHFCGRNSGTMGICMLGTYSIILPTEEAVNSLVDLLTWKAEQEFFEVFSTSPHPTNPTLPVIAGHRDGCATECPGTLLYQHLPEVRLLVANQLMECNGESVVIAIYPNPVVDGNLFVEWQGDESYLLEIFDLTGRSVFSGRFEIPTDQNHTIQFSPSMPQGIYLVSIKSRSKYLVRKIYWSGGTS